MVKVLVERKPFENWSAVIDCSGKGWNQKGKVPCGSMLEVGTEDLLCRSWHRFPDYKGVDYGFICPVCKCFTSMGEKIEEELKILARNYDDFDTAGEFA